MKYYDVSSTDLIQVIKKVRSRKIQKFKIKLNKSLDKRVKLNKKKGKV